jgi:hypothetical protein
VRSVATKPIRIRRDPQLTLADWQTFCAASTVEPGGGADESRAQPVEQVPPRSEVDVVRTLAEALAPRLAEQLAARMTSVSPADPVSSPLLTLDQLVAELPPAKAAKTWKRWLYERTRRGEVPGCVKLGGMLFFEREPVRAWIRSGARTTQSSRR